MSDYVPTGNPDDATRYVSKEIRDEFTSIATAINSKRDLEGTTSVSTTSMTIGDVQQTFVIETEKDLAPGMFVYIADAAAPTVNIMFGRLYSYNSTTGLTVVNVSSHYGSGTKASWIIGLSNDNGVSLVNNTFTGHQNFARATVASHATTADIWNALGNQINWTGTATTTIFPDAPQAGSVRELICAAACSFTAGANMLIDGVSSGNTVTCAANDVVIVRAVSTTQFRLTRHRYDGLAQAGVSLVNNNFTGYQNYARATVASAATTSDIWSAAGNQIDFTGTAVVTGFPAAAQAGSSRTLICAAACSFTAGANMLIDGLLSGSTVLCAANDKVIVEAVSTSQFRLTRHRYDGAPQVTVRYSEVTVNSGNGHGSTNTKIRRYTTTKINTGTGITYADSATNGASFTINEPGLYKISSTESSGGAGTYGASVNSAQLTTNIQSITDANRVVLGTASTGTASAPVCEIVKLIAGDVIRPHTDGTLTGTTALNSSFSIIKIADLL